MQAKPDAPSQSVNAWICPNGTLKAMKAKLAQRKRVAGMNVKEAKQAAHAQRVYLAVFDVVEKCAKKRPAGLSTSEAIEAELAGLLVLHVLVLHASGKLDSEETQRRILNMVEGYTAEAVKGLLVKLDIYREPT